MGSLKKKFTHLEQRCTMAFMRSSLAILLILCSASAPAREPRRTPFGIDRVREWFAQKQGGAVELPNPGFEESANGRPAGWSPTGRPVHHTGSSDARTGTGYVTVSRTNTYYTDVACIPGIGYAVLGYARGTRGGETSVTTEWLPVSTEFGPIADSFAIAPDQTSFRLELGAVRGDEWVDFDDLEILSEFVVNGGFEEEGRAWTSTGTVLFATGSGTVFIGTRSAVLSPGAGLGQRVAVNAGDKTYLLSGAVRGGSPALEIAWHGMDMGVIRRDPLILPSSGDWTPFLFRLDPPPPPGTLLLEKLSLEPVFATISLGGESATTEWDSLRFGWEVAVPASIDPHAEQFRNRTEFTFALEAPASYAVTVRSPTGETVLESPGLTGRAGSNTFSWNGTGAGGEAVSPGIYTLRAEVDTVDPASPTVHQATVEVTGFPPSWGFTRDFTRVFPRGAWISVSLFEGVRPGFWLETFQELRSSGFDTAYISFSTLDFDHTEVFDAAEAVDIQLIYGPAFMAYLFYGRAGYEDISPAIVEAEFERFLAEIPDPDRVLAWQVLDEPHGSARPEIELYSESISRLSPDIPPVTVIAQANDFFGIQESLRSPVFVYDPYPTRQWETVGNLNGYVNSLETAVATASGYGVPLWIMLPHFATETLHRNPSIGEARYMAYRALLEGARGYFIFLANLVVSTSGDTVSGMLHERGGTILPVYREINNRIAALEPLLLDWEPSGSPAGTISPHVARRFRDSEGGDYLFVINGDVIHPQSVAVSIPDATGGSVEDVQTEESLPIRPDGLVEVPLAPGEGKVFRLKDGPAGEPAPTPVPDTLDLVDPVASLYEDQWIFDLNISDTAGAVFYYSAVWLFDVSNPSEPVPRIRRYLGEPSAVLNLDGDLLIADKLVGLYRLGEDLQERAVYSGVSGNAADLAVAPDGMLYVAAQREGVRIFDLSDPPGLRLVSESEPMPQANEILLLEDGAEVFAFGEYGDSRLFSVSPEHVLTETARYEDLVNIQDTVLHGETVYAAAVEGGVAVIDLRMRPPRVVGWIDTLEARSLALWGEILFVADGPGGILAYDLKDPLFPRFLKRFAHVQTGTYYGVRVVGDYLYTVSPAGGLYVLPLGKVFPNPSVRMR